MSVAWCWAQLTPMARPRLPGKTARPSLRPPLEIDGEHDYLTEIHPQGESFVRTLADKLTRGAVFLIDYGFPEAEYYHPQRHMGTVMCHQAHQVDGDPLVRRRPKRHHRACELHRRGAGRHEAGLDVLGYCNQARFLMNCGLLKQMEAADLPTRVMAQKLIMEHEMGELFKVIGFYKGEPWQALGFEHGRQNAHAVRQAQHPCFAGSSLCFWRWC